MFSWFCNESVQKSMVFNQKMSPKPIFIDIYWYFEVEFCKMKKKSSTQWGRVVIDSAIYIFWGLTSSNFQTFVASFFWYFASKILKSWYFFFKASPKILWIFDVTWWWWVVLQGFWGNSLDLLQNHDLIPCLTGRIFATTERILMFLHAIAIYVASSAT